MMKISKMGFLNDILSFFKAKPAAVKTAKSQGKYNAAVAEKLNAKKRVFVFDKGARRALKRVQAGKHQHVTDFHWLEKIDNSYAVRFDMQFVEDTGILTIIVDNHEDFTLKAYWNYTPPTPPPEPGGHFQLSVKNDPLSIKNLLIFSDLWQFSGRNLSPGTNFMTSVEADGLEHEMLVESADDSQAENLAVYIDEEPPDKDTVSIVANDTPYPEIYFLDNLRNGDVLKLGVLLTSAIVKNFVFQNNAWSLSDIRLIQIDGFDVDIQPGSQISQWYAFDAGAKEFIISPLGDPFLILGVHLSLIRPDNFPAEQWGKIFQYTNDDQTLTLKVDADYEWFRYLEDIRIKFLVYNLGNEKFTLQLTNISGALRPPDYDALINVVSDDIPGWTSGGVERGHTLGIAVPEMDKEHILRLSLAFDSYYRTIRVSVLPTAQNYVTVINNNSRFPQIKLSNECRYEQTLPVTLEIIEPQDFTVEMNWQNLFAATSESDIDGLTGTFQDTVIQGTAFGTEAHYIIVYGDTDSSDFNVNFATGSDTEGCTITKQSAHVTRIDFAQYNSQAKHYSFNLNYEIVNYEIDVQITMPAGNTYKIWSTSDIQQFAGDWLGNYNLSANVNNSEGGHYIMVYGTWMSWLKTSVQFAADSTTEGCTITPVFAADGAKVEFAQKIPAGAHYKILILVENQ